MTISYTPVLTPILMKEIKNNPTEQSYIGKHIMFYDGVCQYCKGMVEASVTSDTEKLFYFSPLQSSFAQVTLRRYGIDSLALNSVYVISDYGSSDEALRAAAPASNFILLRLTGELRKIGEETSCKPRAVQDAEYQDISDNRYARYGKMEEVSIPTDATRHRYIF